MEDLLDDKKEYKKALSNYIANFKVTNIFIFLVNILILVKMLFIKLF